MQPRNVPCGALAKDSNTSRFRDQPFKTAATKSARTLPTECLKQQEKLLQPRNVPCGALAKDSSTSRFRDQPFKTAATKSARTLPTECLKQLVSSRKNLGEHLPERYRAYGMPQKASLQQGELLQPRNVPCGALAKDSNTSRFRDQPFKTAATKTARTLPTECLKQLVSSRKNLGEHLPERYLRNARKS